MLCCTVHVHIHFFGVPNIHHRHRRHHLYSESSYTYVYIRKVLTSNQSIAYETLIRIRTTQTRPNKTSIQFNSKSSINSMTQWMDGWMDGYTRSYYNPYNAIPPKCWLIQPSSVWIGSNWELRTKNLRPTTPHITDSRVARELRTGTYILTIQLYSNITIQTTIQESGRC